MASPCSILEHGRGNWTRYVGSCPLSQDGTLVGPATLVSNLRIQRIQRTLSRDVIFSSDALNLFNRQYDDISYDISYEQDYRVTPTSPVVPTGITVQPGAPREARLTLRVQY